MDLHTVCMLWKFLKQPFRNPNEDIDHCQVNNTLEMGWEQLEDGDISETQNSLEIWESLMCKKNL